MTQGRSGPTVSSDDHLADTVDPTVPVDPAGRGRREIGGRGLTVPAWSLGTASLGGLYTTVSEHESADLVSHALEVGIDLFDTAPQYGHGVAERRLGRALPLDRSSYRISTKVGRLVIPDPAADTGIFADAAKARVDFDFSAGGIERSLTESMERLGLDRIDMVLIHDPDDHADQAIGEAYPVLHDLRAQGIVDAIGVGMNQSAIPTRFVTETEIDAVLLAGRYTLLDQSAVDDLLPAAREHDVKIVIGGVFNSGCLATVDPPPSRPMFNYAPADDATMHRIGELRRVCTLHGVELPAAALAFPRREPAVVTTLLGSRNSAELDENLTRADAEIPDELWHDLRRHGLIRELDH